MYPLGSMVQSCLFRPCIPGQLSYPAARCTRSNAGTIAAFRKSLARNFASRRACAIFPQLTACVRSAHARPPRPPRFGAPFSKSRVRARTQRIGFMRAIASKSRPDARIRRAVRRAFILSNGKPILARDVLERSYPRLKIFLRGHRRAVWRALCMDAECIGRMLKGRGRPCLWAKRA
jgi:hypothetical protein